MSKADWHRLFIHLPWGMLAVGLFLYHPLLGATACFMELGYEFINDWREHDKSFKDVIGIVWGILIGGYTLFALKIFGVI